MGTAYSQNMPTSLADQLIILTNLNATPNNNVTGASTGKIWVIEGDNTATEGIPIYIKIADASSATLGVTRPDFTLFVPPGKIGCYVFPEGHAYSSGVSLWCSTTSKDFGSSQVPSGFTLKIIGS